MADDKKVPQRSARQSKVVVKLPKQYKRMSAMTKDRTVAKLFTRLMVNVYRDIQRV